MMDRLTYTITLPDGTKTAPISGTVTLDELWYPFIQVTATIPLPATLPDPRAGTQRVTLTMQQDFNDPTRASKLSGSVAALTALYGGSVSAVTVANTVLWNTGDYRPATIRSLNLLLRSRSAGPNGTLEVKLASNDAMLADFAMLTKDQVAATIGPSTLAALVPWVVQKVDPTAVFTEISKDFDLSALARTYPGPLTGIWWMFGVTALDFLTTVLQIAAARLWADDSGLWHLAADPANRSATTTIAATANLTDYADTIDRDDDDFANVVAVIYDVVFVNSDGSTVDGNFFEVADGSAGNAKKVKTVHRDGGTWNTVSGGTVPSGAAAYLLANYTRLGHAVSTKSLADLNAQPGNNLSITVNSTPVTGHLSSVEFDFESAEMSIRARDIS